jgi:hypothetical protein
MRYKGSESRSKTESGCVIRDQNPEVRPNQNPWAHCGLELIPLVSRLEKGKERAQD